MAKPDITRLLIDSALQPELCRRLAEAPDSVFVEYDLSAEEREILRHPDRRLLPLLGAALRVSIGRREEPEPRAPESEERSRKPGAGMARSVSFSRPQEIPVADESRMPLRPSQDTRQVHEEVAVPNESRMLPGALMALTVVPCLIGERIAFAAWIAPMQEGADPSHAPPPPGANLPGSPLTPLHAVIQISAAQSHNGAGIPQVSMWASFRHSSNAIAPAPPESAGNPDASPFGSAFESPEVQSAAAAVYSAAPEDRYEKLVALTRALHAGDVR